MPFLRAFASACVLLALVGFVTCASSEILTVPDDVESIQLALDYGVDTVLVRPGSYDEDLVVRHGVYLSAASNDLDEPSPAIRGLLIAVPAGPVPLGQVVIRRLQFQERVFIENDHHPWSIYFDGCRLLAGLRDRSGYVSTAEIRLKGCTIDQGILVSVDGAVIADSSVIDGGLRVWTNLGHVRVTNSSITGTPQTVGIGVDNATSCTVIGSTIRGVMQPIITQVEQSAEIRDNVIEDCDTGVNITMAGGPESVVISGNVVRRCGDAGIRAWARHATVKDNRISGGSGSGMEIITDYMGGLVANNVVTDCGGAGIWVEGSEMVVRSNTSGFNRGPGFIASVREFTHNIGYGNGGHGLTGSPMFRVACNDWFLNGLGPVDGLFSSPDDLHLDPAFCDTTERDLRLSASSPLLDHETCQTIGALGSGCVTTPTLVSAFTARRLDEGVELRWELGQSERIQEVWVERANHVSGPWKALRIAPSSAGVASVMIDRDVEAGTAYWYRLMGRLRDAVATLAAPLRVEAGARFGFSLEALTPNPGSGPVRIPFTVPHPALVALDVIDVQGRLVASLVNRWVNAGPHVIDWDPPASAAGVHFVRLRFPGGYEVRRVVRLR